MERYRGNTQFNVGSDFAVDSGSEFKGIVFVRRRNHEKRSMRVMSERLNQLV